MPIRILLVSSVLPRNSNGGELILYRHLWQSSPFKVAIATDDPTRVAEDMTVEAVIKLPIHPLLTRLAQTRAARWIHGVRQLLSSFYDTRLLRRYIQEQPPDLILTVAHGDLCWLAQKLAQEYSIPLVTIFHDWWPDLAYVHDWVRHAIAHRFRQLYRQSQLAFCVSEAMQQALGQHQNAQILLPIPQQISLEGNPKKKALSNKLTAVYAGNLSDIYGPLLQKLATISQSVDTFQLKLLGPVPDWPMEKVQEFQLQGIYTGFLPRNQLIQALWEADVLLVIMSFAESDQKRMQTSFPSKLLEYCQFGKALVIWGPKGCSVVDWGQKYDSARVVTSPVVEDLVRAVIDLSKEPIEQERLGQKALEMAQTMFNPLTIQQQFIESLYSITKL
ncbi:glycosyltransferase [Trichocoleus sp. FACHB-46]|nr:glycosyltransferase [Trichocoleus sp. FACHB-46]